MEKDKDRDKLIAEQAIKISNLSTMLDEQEDIIEPLQNKVILLEAKLNTGIENIVVFVLEYVQRKATVSDMVDNNGILAMQSDIIKELKLKELKLKEGRG
jgi:hypothetical protein